MAESKTSNNPAHPQNEAMQREQGKPAAERDRVPGKGDVERQREESSIGKREDRDRSDRNETLSAFGSKKDSDQTPSQPTNR